jgi:microcystin degradation protein MlrC
VRIAIGSLLQETNTFVPSRTTVDTFKQHCLRRDTELLDGCGAPWGEIPGFLSVLAEAGATPVPTLAAHGGSNGPVMRETFHVLVTEMVHRLAARLPVDGVLLALHGAMVVEDESDAEAEIVERVRNVLPPGTPIGVSLDLHGHITPRMLQPDVFFVGYREYPHIDMLETGQRTARLLMDVLAGRCRPVMALAKRPMLASPARARTTDQPLSGLMAEARRLERGGAVLQASLFPVQPWIDVPDLGFAALVCADDDHEAAQQAADHLADMAWAARAEFASPGEMRELAFRYVSRPLYPLDSW